MSDISATTVIFIMANLAMGGIIFLNFRNNSRNIKNGKIEIKFTEIDEGDEVNTIKHTDLILEIRYCLIRGSRYNKEEVAVLINELVQKKCKLRGFRIRDNTKKTLKEIKDIIERIKPLLPRETSSELIAAEYRISEKTIPHWSKNVFVKT